MSCGGTIRLKIKLGDKQEASKLYDGMCHRYLRAVETSMEENDNVMVLEFLFDNNNLWFDTYGIRCLVALDYDGNDYYGEFCRTYNCEMEVQYDTVADYGDLHCYEYDKDGELVNETIHPFEEFVVADPDNGKG